MTLISWRGGRRTRGKGGEGQRKKNGVFQKPLAKKMKASNLTSGKSKTWTKTT